MKVEINDVINITDLVVPFTSTEIEMARSFDAFIPKDLPSYMMRFGQGNFNDSLDILHPETWQCHSHEVFFEPALQATWIKAHEISGVQFARTIYGDELIATGGDQHGIVFKSQLFGGFISLGDTFAEGLGNAFAPQFWDVMRASKIFFDSSGNRHPTLTLKRNSSSKEVAEFLLEFGGATAFDNEQAACFFFPKHHFMVTMCNVAAWGIGSALVFAVGEKSDRTFLTQLKTELEFLGFE